MNPTEPTLVIPPDIAGQYAKRVQELLEQRPGQFLTVPEIVAALKCVERRVREGLDRLAYERKVVVQSRHVAGHRGAMPREYALASTTLNHAQ